ncbi:hypothetical protein [Staphylococcus agnetis]|uniref:hypothetical protein n=1 Tax=Staphylococcus agnetis TaxID=985762 RepID=UPI00208F8BBC|nr:hypothetical protein [Staphylococcus agnetis]MCO4349175.1 hypothetical protein [Staphylococcus agnetis]
MVEVKTLEELNEANVEHAQIVITDNINVESPITLATGLQLEGKARSIEITGNGQLITLTANNALKNLTLRTKKHEDAVSFQSQGVNGDFKLEHVTTYGAINLTADDASDDIRVEITDVDVVEADVTHKSEGPSGFGVTVIQGGLTVWNRTPQIRFDTQITDVSIGRDGEPVNGSGVFVSGTKEAKIHANLITTKDVYTHGLLKQGVADRISGGVFTVSNAHVERVENHGITKTYGFNDMVLDNWGAVKEWIVQNDVLSEGTSGIGFVNFGHIQLLDIQAPIMTKGTGARGINNYDGTIKELHLKRIETHGDGAVGIQISKPVGQITVHENVETYGGTGESLVKGVIKELSAIGISILDGAEVEGLEVKGNVYTYGKEIAPVQNEGVVKNGLNIHGEAANKFE